MLWSADDSAGRRLEQLLNDRRNRGALAGGQEGYAVVVQPHGDFKLSTFSPFDRVPGDRSLAP